MASDYEKRILRVLDHIHGNPAGDLSLDALADVAAMSRFHWHRVFHGMTGETLADAVRRIRLHRSACWLVQTDMPMADVAAQAGFGNTQSYIRAFRKSYQNQEGVERPIALEEIKGMMAAQLNRGIFAIRDRPPEPVEGALPVAHAAVRLRQV